MDVGVRALIVQTISEIYLLSSETAAKDRTSNRKDRAIGPGLANRRAFRRWQLTGSPAAAVFCSHSSGFDVQIHDETSPQAGIVSFMQEFPLVGLAEKGNSCPQTEFRKGHAKAT